MVIHYKCDGVLWLQLFQNYKVCWQQYYRRINPISCVQLSIFSDNQLHDLVLQLKVATILGLAQQNGFHKENASIAANSAPKKPFVTDVKADQEGGMEINFGHRLPSQA